MSNYHYNDQSGHNQGCLNKSQYSDLKDTINYSCDQPCLCRWSDERSSKDKMYYNWFVLDQPMQLPPPGKQLPTPPNDNCKKEK